MATPNRPGNATSYHMIGFEKNADALADVIVAAGNEAEHFAAIGQPEGVEVGAQQQER
ncbi:MAG: hypothetical protein U9Q71_09510 [Pseudomonadota bacterium]|nr:hypothetical protein [Pseudomonadota bacterium]